MFLYELRSADIDRELEQTAGDIERAGSAGQPTAGSLGPEMGTMGAAQQQPGAFPQNEPQVPSIGAETPTPVEDDIFKKKVDSYLLSAVKGMDFVSKYQHRERSPSHPYRILQKDTDELNHLRDRLRGKINMIGMETPIGGFDNPEGKYFQDMLAFVDRVLSLKKRITKPGRDRAIGRTGKFDKRSPSKNEKRKTR